MAERSMGKDKGMKKKPKVAKPKSTTPPPPPVVGKRKPTPESEAPANG